MAKHVIRGIQFDDENGLVIFEFVTPDTDLRASGMVMNHVIAVPVTEDPEDKLLAVAKAAHSALVFALEEFQASYAPPLPSEAVAEDEDDDEPGPYDNPNER